MKEGIRLELPGYNRYFTLFKDEPGLIALFDTKRKVFWINDSYDHDAEKKYIRFEHEEKEAAEGDAPLGLTLEEAEMLTATLARQFELAAMFGRMLNPAREDEESIKWTAKLFSEAIRIVLRHAGLSDDWRGEGRSEK